MINHFEPFPTLETESLLLRKIEIEDFNEVFALRSHPEMHQYTDTIPDTFVDQSISYINRVDKGVKENLFVLWGIELKSTQKIIGTICIWSLDEVRNSGELGYGIHPDYQKQGYMREAIMSVVNFGFSVMKLSVIEAFTEINNLNSVNLLKRLNFKYDKIIIDVGQNKKQDFHMVVYHITP